MRLWLALIAGLVLRGKFRVTRVMKLCKASGVSREALEVNLEAAVALAECDIGLQKFERAVATLTPHILAASNHPQGRQVPRDAVARPHLAWAIPGNHRRPEPLRGLRPRYARGFRYLANLAHIHGVRGELVEARRAMAAQCGARTER